MASAFFAHHSWVASYMPLFETTKRRNLRIPIDQVPGEQTKAAKIAANRFAGECERYCRLLEVTPQAELVAHALQLGAITQAQRDALLKHVAPPRAVVPDQDSPTEITILRASERHPASARETVASALNHRKYVADFCAFTGIQRLRDLHLGLVVTWVAHLRNQEWAWDSRRHALLWLRRASAVAPSLGMPDVLDRMRIDRREVDEQIEVDAWTLRELGRALRAFAPSRQRRDRPRSKMPGAGLTERRAATIDHRPRVALILGGFLGLRPSEAIACDVGHLDLAAATLRTGKKNAASVRILALPRILLPWLAPLVLDRQPEDPLLAGWSPRAVGRRLTATSYTQWLGPLLREATGRPLQAKHLRKSFATWTAEVLPGHHTEAYLGHDDPRVTKMTAQRYRAKGAVELLRPAAAAIERQILRSMHQAWASELPPGWSLPSRLPVLSTKVVSTYVDWLQ